MAMFNFRGKKKNVVLSVILFYILLSLQWSNLRIAKHFNAGFKTFLPTTSHVKNVNLKQYKPEAMKGDSIADLRSQLSLQFPYDASQPMPKRVWQTWRDPLTSPKMPRKFKKFAGKWNDMVDKSSGYHYTLVPDAHIPSLLENLYGGVPQIIQAFDALPLNIIKADFFRYLILYARGGIYSDMDTEPLKKLHTWPSVNGTSWLSTDTPVYYKNYDSSSNPVIQEPGFVVGLEADPDRPDWHEYYARRIQFCQWTIQSKPGHPLLRELIINITATTLGSVESYSSEGRPSFLVDESNKEDYNINLRDKKRFDTDVDYSQKKNSKNTDNSDIMNWAGPGVFSDAVFGYINNLIQTNKDILILNDNLKVEDSTNKFYTKVIDALQVGNFFQWEFFSLIKSPVIVDDIMVLPITSFSPDVGHMGAGSSSNELALVKHMFEGSWKGGK